MDPVEEVFRSEPQSSSVTARLVTLEDLLTEDTESLRVRIVPGEGQVVNPALSEVTVLIFDNDGEIIKEFFVSGKSLFVF